MCLVHGGSLLGDPHIGQTLPLLEPFVRSRRFEN